MEMDCGDWFVRDGIVVIPKDAEIAAGSVIAPEVFIFNNNEASILLKERQPRKVMEIVG
jgi:hypothetical protein